MVYLHADPVSKGRGVLCFFERMWKKDGRGKMRRHTLEILERAYCRACEALPEVEVRDKAKALYKRLQALDVYWRHGSGGIRR